MNRTFSPLERYMVALEAVAGTTTAGIRLVELAAWCGMPVGSTQRVIQTLCSTAR